MIKFYSSTEEGFIEMDKWCPQYWINVETPDDDDRRRLASIGVPSSFLENVCDIDERPRFDREDGWLLTILRIPHHVKRNHRHYITVPLGILTKGDIIITICNTATTIISALIEQCNKRHITIGKQPDFVLRIMYTSTYWYLTYLKEINNTMQEYTRDLRRGVSNDLLLQMMDLQKSLVYFNTSLQGNSMLLDRLNKMFDDDCDAAFSEDVEIELSQASNTVNVYMEILSNSMDTFASVISNNVNNVMKTMTSISIILMIPTLIASFYGMNVTVWMGGEPLAFLLIIVISFGLSALVWFLLRHKGWL